jgi:hypothetical protein
MDPSSSQPIEPAREKRFSFSHVDRHGQTWEGVFLYHRPNLRDLLRIGAERARLCEGQPVEREFLILAGMLARLKVVLREVPRWLRWEDLEEIELVKRLDEEVDRIEGAWFRGDDAARGGEEPGARAGAGQGRPVPVAPVVGAEVPASAHQR